jgi:hypothetical protein
MAIGLRPGETPGTEKGAREVRTPKANVVSITAVTEAELAETMRRQILSWPCKVNVDEVGVTLLVGLCQILEQTYGQNFGEHLMRLSDAAKARLAFDGGGPTHRMRMAA